MINLRLVLENPWSRGKFQNKWSKTKKLWGHRVFEMQLYKFSTDLLGFAVNTGWRGRDHAGPEFELMLFTYTLVIKFYDSRHWDYDTNKWQVYNEENKCLKSE